MDLTELWNGSSWTEVGDLNTARIVVSGTGTATAALCAGGYDFNPNITTKTELWNGSSWTEVGDLNTARYGLAASGTTTGALVFGGGPGTKAVTEDWNGASWSEVADLNVARVSLAGAGTLTSALAFGGYTTAATASTEEWSGSSIASKVLTD
jgi:hypothetical protein